MSLAVRIDLDSPTPHYEQLRAQLAALVTAGDRPRCDAQIVRESAHRGQPLPVGQVARTYRDLEAAGLVTTRRRVGTLVTAPAATLSRTAVTDAAARFGRLARHHALTDTEIRDVVAAALLVEGRPGDDRSATVSAG